jgi:hypothetical protein
MLPVKLSNQVLQVLKPALSFAKGTIKREIKQGISQLYQTDQGNLFVVVRPEGRELVVVAVAGKNLYFSQQEIISFARKNGYLTLRFHTRHPEHLSKGLQGLNITLIEKRKHLIGSDEFVYRMVL